MRKVTNALQVAELFKELSEEEQARLDRWAAFFSILTGSLIIGAMFLMATYS
jgi:hypothetical protein